MEFFVEYCDNQASPNAIGFKGASGNRATILVAKHSEKYRLQSDTVTMLPVLVELLLARLKKAGGPDCKVFFSSPLPASDIFNYANEHFIAKSRVKELQVSANTTNDQKIFNLAGFYRKICLS